jgi:aspartyl-tRNA(Asn)/glutamyl-tRNA(Gln) amidotransferase subunit B
MDSGGKHSGTAGGTGCWMPVIGLEVHIQLNTKSKLFCGCVVEHGGSPNIRTCPVCLGHPGTLPVPNRAAVEKALVLGLALGCSIDRRSVFARKNYFYPDLPKGYQITQYDHPLCSTGHLAYKLTDGRLMDAEITRVHIEEDAGKLVVLDDDKTGVDMNRAGVALAEVVTEPCFNAPAEAGAFLRELHSLAVRLGVTSGSMHEGALRCDANLSLRNGGTGMVTARTELKNLNSFRFMEQALEYEYRRQVALAETGGRLAKQTLLWDESAHRTVVMRNKEESEEYRYFPEPDLPPLIVDDSLLEAAEEKASANSGAGLERFLRMFELTGDDVSFITSTEETLAFFRNAVESAGQMSPELAHGIAHWMRHACASNGGTETGIGPAEIAQFAERIHLNGVPGNIARQALKNAMEHARPLSDALDEELSRMPATADVDRVIIDIVKAHPDAVASWTAGKRNAAMFLVGMVVRELHGCCDARHVEERVRRELMRLTDEGGSAPDAGNGV